MKFKLFKPIANNTPVIRDKKEGITKAKEIESPKQILDKALIKKNKYFSMHVQKISTLKDLTELPAKDEQFRLITQQHFNTFTFILYIIEKHGQINDLDVITFNINEGTILALLDLLDRKIILNLRIVISDSVKFRMPQRVEQLKKAYEDRKESGNFMVLFVWNHSKIAIAKTGENYYIIEGSGNFSSNAEIEQYIFENNKEMYEFHKGWINDVLFSDHRGKRLEYLE